MVIKTSEQVERISSSDLQYLYTDIYSALREYYLPIDLVEALAYLEVATFKRLPDLDEIKKAYNKLKQETIDAGLYRFSDNIKDTLDYFEETILKSNDVYSEITVAEPTVTQDDIEEDTNDFGEGILEETPDGKRIFRFSKIEKS